jgi:hypothetical protein
MHTSHLLALFAASYLALTATASPTGTITATKSTLALKPRAEEAEEPGVCAGFLLPTTPMCCNETADGEDGLDCKEGECNNSFGNGKK